MYTKSPLALRGFLFVLLKLILFFKKAKVFLWGDDII